MADASLRHPTVTIVQAIEYLKMGMIAKKKPAILLWGPPGVGKSASVHQAMELANQKLEENHRLRGILDLRLNSHNPVELLGLPIHDKEEDVARWIPPKFFRPLTEEPWILLLEELTTAPAASMNAALEMVHDRKVGEWRFHPETIVIAAANPITSMAAVSRLTAPLANRFSLHLEVRPDLDSFIDYANRNGVHELVVGFLRFRSNLLLVMPEAQGDVKGWASPRSWEHLSDVLQMLYLEVGDAVPVEVSAAAVGPAVGTEFSAYSRMQGVGDLLADITERGERAERFGDRPMDVAYAIEVALARRIVTAYQGTNQEAIDRAEGMIGWSVRNFNPTLQALLFSDIVSTSRNTPAFLAIPTKSQGWRSWEADHRETLKALVAGGR